MPSKPECRINQIVRDGYYRKTYNKKNGSHIKGKYIKQTCTKDMGKPGKAIKPKSKTKTKSKKVLTKDGNKGFLNEYGYKENDSFAKRKKALDNAIKKHSALKVEKHIGLLLNYSKEDLKRIKLLTKDFKYVKSIRLKEKKMLNEQDKKNVKKITVEKKTIDINKSIKNGIKLTNLDKSPKISNNKGINNKNLIPKMHNNNLQTNNNLTSKRLNNNSINNNLTPKISNNNLKTNNNLTSKRLNNNSINNNLTPKRLNNNSINNNLTPKRLNNNGINNNLTHKILNNNNIRKINKPNNNNNN
jgi:hypothetical protein